MKKILVVEEDLAFRDILLSLLQPVAELKLEGASCLEDGLDLLEQKGWDALVLGLNVGGRYGPEAVGEIRRITPNLPLVVLTPSGDSVAPMECLGLGADDILCKSNLSSEELFRRLLYAKASAVNRQE